MNQVTQDIGQKLWNLCNLLRDDGVTYHQYVTELTYLLFLKMAKETGVEDKITAGYRWDKCMQHYELQVNFEKTALIRVHEFTEDYWTHRLRGFDIAPAGSRQRADISHYFDLALTMSRDVSDESVMKYALRRISSIVVRKENWSLFEAQLCRVVVGYPRRATAVSRSI